MPTRPARLIAIFALVTAATVAQQFEFRGHVNLNIGPPPCYYCPPTSSTYTIDGSHVELTSSSLSLFAFNNQDVIGIGSLTGPNSIEVAALALTTNTFNLGGNFRIGTTAHAAVTAPPGDFAIIGVSLTTTVTAYAGLGVLFLDPTSFIVLGEGTCDATGNFQVSAPIPNEPSVVGLAVTGQAYVVGASAAFFTNPATKTVHP